MSRQDFYRAARPVKRRHSLKLPFFSLLIIVGLCAGVYYYIEYKSPAKPLKNLNVTATNNNSPVQSGSPKATSTTKTSPCAGNNQPKLALISISQRRLWACADTTVAYDSAVVTGMENLAADLTPTGTYHVYAKQTNLYLNGSDSTGSWHDYVYYWMPFLDNQYGIYGFHDATWRPADAFGNISPYSSNASHGCVELPLATAKWLFTWVSIGTPVTIES